MHAAIGHLPTAVGKPAPERTGGISGFVYRRVRGVTRLVGQGVSRSLSALTSVLGSSASLPQREAVVAAMNGVLGDHLEASHNPLATPMRLRSAGCALPLDRDALSARFPQASGKLLVLVHGLCMNDQQWRASGHDHGEALAHALGYTPLYLRYNTGRHISTNGREFAGVLQRLVEAWPVPIEEVTLLCHSMGGLVARSALAIGFDQHSQWTRLRLRVVFLGTPHHGAPLERAGSWADQLIGISPYSAPFVRLGQLRSAGIQDLRHGNVHDCDWQHGNAHVDRRRPVPLPPSVRAYAIAASTQETRKDGDDARLRGDGLVPIPSALGDHADPAFALRIPAVRRWVAYGTNHLQLQSSTAVCSRVENWLRTAPGRAARKE
jgi:pimeloyl-ACP methyl ester carboxylesterase